jgi:hypothetical protein
VAAIHSHSSFFVFLFFSDVLTFVVGVSASAPTAASASTPTAAYAPASSAASAYFPSCKASASSSSCNASAFSSSYKASASTGPVVAIASASARDERRTSVRRTANDSRTAVARARHDVVVRRARVHAAVQFIVHTAVVRALVVCAVV